MKITNENLGYYTESNVFIKNPFSSHHSQSVGSPFCRQFPAFILLLLLILSRLSASPLAHAQLEQPYHNFPLHGGANLEYVSFRVPGFLV